MSVHIDLVNTELFKATFRPQVLEFERMINEERAAKKMAEGKLLATVGNLLATMAFSDEEIANITNTDLSYITSIKKDMDL